jgi:hypothetical protein
LFSMCGDGSFSVSVEVDRFSIPRVSTLVRNLPGKIGEAPSEIHI